jgi:hypothetical protein
MKVRMGALAGALVAVVALGGCGSDDAPGSGSGSGSGDAAAKQVEGGRSAEETLKRFAAAVADNDKATACGLMLEGTRFVFAQKEEAPDCETAVSVLSGKIADKDAYKAMVPSGVEVEGETAEVSGYCGDGWRTASGEKFDGDGEDPNDLGTLTLRNTGTGWLVTDYTSDEEYSSCGG